MSQVSSGSFSDVANEVVRKYFAAWKSHDEALLQEVFDQDATYLVEGGQTFRGAGQLLGYWAANKAKQANVRCEHVLLQADAGARTFSFLFRAGFHDLRARTHVELSGVAEVKLSSAGQIGEFREWYIKAERGELAEALIYDIPSRLYRHWAKFSKGLVVIVGSIGRFLRPLVTPLLFIFYFSLVILTGYLNFIENIAFDVFDEGAERRVSNFMNACFAVGLVAQFAWEFIRKDAEALTAERVLEEEDALKFMHLNMTGAAEVSILAGDFSFISQNARLERLLHDLAARDRLRLFSYKSEAEVVQEAQSSGRHREMIKLLRDRQRIRFDVPVRERCSLVVRAGSSCFLYRYNDAGLGDAVGLVRSEGRTSYVFQLMRGFIGAFR